MIYTYILFKQDPANQAEYDSLIATYDLSGNVAKEGRDIAQFIRKGDEQTDESGDYIRDSEGRILAKQGYFYWLLSKLEKDTFDSLEEAGVLLGWAYTKNTLAGVNTLLNSTFTNRYFEDSQP